MPHILIAEDESELVELYRLVFARSGFELSVAANGQEAVELAHTLRPDLVLMDVMMPVMNGVEACRQLRADPDLAGVRIVMLSSQCDARIRPAAQDAGALDFWTKPISPRALLAQVQGVLQQHRSPDPGLPRQQACRSV